mmetsp:Transcript_16647/g.44019  ORF Transcript_16647/g.44019 Transcript_16647/m.44019 type:complete len:306 (-) Transcript_16647:286-1203(-)
MPGLADIILAQDDDLDLEDVELTRQLEELQAKRKVLSSGAVTAVPEDPQNTEPPVDQVAEIPVSPQRRAHARSLADEILNSSGSGNVEQELAAMEQELEQHLSAYRNQRQSAEGERVDAAPVETPDASPAHSGDEYAAGGTNGFGEPAWDDENAPPELRDLRAEAAKMEHAFPEVAGEDRSWNPPPKARRQPQHLTRTYDRDANRASAPIDESIQSMNGELADLEVRLQALQSRQCLSLKPDSASAGEPAHVSRSVAEMRLQSEHLRKCMQADGGKGLLKLDRSLFGVSKACADAGSGFARASDN